MPPNPQVKSVLNELAASARPMPQSEAAWLATYRSELEGITAMQGLPPRCHVVERQVRVEGRSIRLRLYRNGQKGALPTMLFIHGGGFVAGSLASYDIPLRALALRSGWQVAAVDYRLAPEDVYPAAPDDCFAAFCALGGESGLGSDRAMIVVGGDSAGGLLATVTAMRARDAGLTLALQVLLYPNTDLRPGDHHQSRMQHDGVVIRMDELYRSLDAYLPAQDRAHPHVSPLLATDLSGLCPALLVTNEIDPLRDEAEVYGDRLRKAGVQVEHVRYEGMIHSVLQRAARIDAGDDLITFVADRLRRLTRVD